MKGIMKENQLFIVREYEFNKPVFQKIDSINHSCIRKCQNENFHTFE